MSGRNGNPKHNLRYVPEYRVWQAMKARCANPNDKSYKNYGARGITVCQRWINSPLNFFNDVGARPTDKHAIDRIDNDKGYTPSNCRWVLQAENNRNSRQSKIWILNGIEYASSSLAAECLGVSRATIRDRCLGRNGTRSIKPKEGCYTKMLYNI